MKKVKLLASIIICLFMNWNVYALAETISVSDNFYAIKTDNSLWTWNRDENGTIQNPYQILNDVWSVQSGYAIKSDETLWKCEDTPSMVEENVDSVSAGSTATLFRKKDNTLWGIGANWSGEMATGEETERYDKPVKVMYNVQDTAGGYSHTVILKTDGSVWTSGSNEYGQLGVGNSIDYSLYPLKIMEGISKIYAGETSTFAIDENGTMYRWGCNYGNGVGLRDEDVVYTPIKYTDNVESVCSHWGFNLVLKQDDTLWIYGDSEDSTEGYTVLYAGTANFHHLPEKIFDVVNSISEWKSADNHSTLILTNKGELYEFDIVPDRQAQTFEIKTTKIMDDVKVVTEPSAVVKKDFIDILDKSDEIQKAVNALYKADIIDGTSDTEFSPDKPVTRAEMAALLLRLTARDDSNGNGGFADVSDDKWYYNTAGAAKEYGIVSGFEDNTFRGDDTVSKVQAISLMARVLRNERNLTDDEIKAEDYSLIPEWAIDDISLAIKENLILSKSDLTNPNDGMTRGDAAVILYRLYQKI